MQATEGSTSSPSTQNAADAKIVTDLNTVTEKMDLCESMLRPGDGSPAPSLKDNETLLAVIGFLEACAPRMVELVEAATLGALSEDTLVQCLAVNDRLQKLLADVETVSLTETSATTTAASVPAKSASEEFDDFLLDDSQEDAKQSSPADPFGGNTDVLTPAPMGKSTGEEEDDLKKPAATVNEDEKKLAAEPGKKDDFDAFFEERTSSNTT